MPSPPAVPYPLPDYPRAPASDISALAARVLEHFDIEALTRLPDLLRDLGRASDADSVTRAVVKMFVHDTAAPAPRSMLLARWKQDVRPLLLTILAWDVFDWQSTLAQIGRKLTATVSGSSGKLLIDGRAIDITSWKLVPPSFTALSPLPPGDDTE